MPATAAAGARDRASEVTRRSILAATEHLLATGGAEGLSIREVCTRARVTPPTIYHHFGDKAALVDRVVDECFATFDRALERRPRPSDPVEALRAGFDRYLDYGTRHPTHYRLMFEPHRARPTASGAAAYDRLRRLMGAVAASGRLRHSVEDATAVFWAANHGATALVVSGFWPRDTPAIALVRDAMITQLTRPIGGARQGRTRRTVEKGSKPPWQAPTSRRESPTSIPSSKATSRPGATRRRSTASRSSARSRAT